MGDASALGFGHFLAQADIVAKVLLGVLAVMSAISWYLIVYKGIGQVIRQGRSQQVPRLLLERHLARGRSRTSSASTACASRSAISRRIRCTPRRITPSSARPSSRRRAARQEFLTRTIKKVLDEETTSLENGLTMLATIGATAPFVGLFGTVWGVYHALVAIGMSGSGMLDKVAGPVGEALIMTGIGLAVALPAVMGYNWLTRSNRVLTAKLDAFAFELLTFLSMGRALQDRPPSRAACRSRP